MRKSSKRAGATPTTSSKSSNPESAKPTLLRQTRRAAGKFRPREQADVLLEEADDDGEE